MSNWYYCSNGHNPIFLRHPHQPPPCTTCRGATALAHNVVRFNGANYTVQWHTQAANGEILERPMLKIVTQVGNIQYSVLLTDDVLPYDTQNITADTTLAPPGGGRWVDAQLTQHHGGSLGRNPPPIPNALRDPRLHIGSHGGNNQYGLVHVLHRHRTMFNNGVNAPAAEFDLTRFRDNLRTMTGNPAGQGTGVRQIAAQANLNLALHGVANYQRSMLVISPGALGAPSYIKTCWSEQNTLGGLGQNPVIIRRW